MVDTVNGKVRYRAWPKKRGRPKSAATLMQNERFASAQRLAKTAPYQLVNRLKDATAGTGLYPRDLITQMILHPRFSFIEEDGRTVQYRRAQVRSRVFQGFELRLDSDLSAPSFTDTYPDWPLPILDSAGFWNVSEPDRITVPEHVTSMILFAGVWFPADASATIQIEKNGESADLRYFIAPNQTEAQTLSTGPIIVTPGDFFRLRVRPTINTTLKTPGTFLSGVIIGTDF